MTTTNITVRIDTESKKEFDAFCENVGLNATAAVNMFIKAVLRTRELPFTVTDINNWQSKQLYGVRAVEAIKKMRALSAINGNATMTLNEINSEIDISRAEARKLSC